RHPVVLWAQDDSDVFLTIEVPDGEVTLGEKSVDFVGNKDDDKYELNLTLFDKVNSEQSVLRKSGGVFYYHLKKVEDKWWPRLTEEEKKYSYIKTDFSRWRDEDESDDEKPAAPGGFDMSQFGM
ncbi:hypothetical protein GGI02_006019, partial [Coemansia sp. RSA 2322]